MVIKRNTTISVNVFDNWNAHFDENCQHPKSFVINLF